MQNLASENAGLPQVQIVKTAPKVAEEKLFSHRKCYLGISIDNPVFYGSSLEALLLWTAGKFDRSLVIIGDYLRRHNEHIFNGLTGPAAESAALLAGDLFLQKTSSVLRKFTEPQFQLVRWKDCLQSNEYKSSKAILDKLFTSDEAFRASVQKDALAFIRRLKKRNQPLKTSAEESIEISSMYLLEEIAVFSALSEQGWNVELYPGPELRVLVEIANGNYPDVPDGLKKRINVELSIGKT